MGILEAFGTFSVGPAYDYKGERQRHARGQSEDIAPPSMMVLVDTPVWSLALRRRPENRSPPERHVTHALAELIREGRVQMLGPIRQELPSGLREEAQLCKLRDYLQAFPENPLELSDYEDAAQMNNRCRAQGIAGSAVDFPICAAARRRGWTILIIDRDFQNYASVLALRLHCI
jgi:predicted nucleic acid-binding protein